MGRGKWEGRGFPAHLQKGPSKRGQGGAIVRSMVSIYVAEKERNYHWKAREDDEKTEKKKVQKKKSSLSSSKLNNKG